MRTLQQLMTDNLIVKHLAGSHAYGTSTPASDVDYRGIFVADPVNVRTPFFKVEEAKDTNEEDTVLYELGQYMKLTLECNPNVVETLWVDQKDIVVSTPAYELLRACRQQLLTTKIAYTTSGYALAQLKRIRGHNKWINNPQPESRPQMVDFVSMVQHFPATGSLPLMPRDFSLRSFASDWRLVPFGKDTFGLYHVPGRSTYNPDTGTLNDDFDGETRSELGVPLFIVKFNRQEYEDAKLRWEQYWEWKKNRNAKRSVLEEQFGYDTKHAMHLVRLLRMGVEALSEGVIKVKRPDAAELLRIRDGAWTYEEVVQYADDMHRQVMEVLLPKSTLPNKPDLKLAANLVMEVQDAIWQKRPTKNQ